MVRQSFHGCLELEQQNTTTKPKNYQIFVSQIRKQQQNQKVIKYLYLK